ncbi:unnamed protein product [Rotaria magnacalcarata]|uniref:Uncharacterized protein n=1 Tax=Rotaria magnacalcarata TaxID=392030 RepID=A0A815X6Q5_9BILA|nr:unnamed protein product [Rotaria magnacalcarata]CAF1553058.1 unnamed protein product [Rotaria magnacalcarata]CAF5103846.1 unnamed protein product [Rotaria magnacalcarata]
MAVNGSKFGPCRNESYFHRIRSETPRILVVYGRKRRRNDIRFDRPGTRSDNNVNSNARSTDAGASHYLPSQPPPPHNRVKDDFPNESTTVDHDNYTSAIQTTADTSPNYGLDLSSDYCEFVSFSFVISADVVVSSFGACCSSELSAV